MQRVVITGLGAVTPIGNTVDEFWESLVVGKNGVDRIVGFDTSEFSTQIAAQVKDVEFEKRFDKKEIRRTSRFIMFAVMASMEALEDANLTITEENAHNIGVEIGSGIGGLEILEDACRTLLNRGPSKVSPFTVPMMICDMAAGQVAIKTGAKGPNASSVTACASSGHSIANAFSLIQRGLATTMIAGGAEACVTPIGLASFCASRSLSTRNDDPEHASRPFDLNRDGFVMGEGSGVVILESLESAQKRGAKIYAEIIGFGSTGDAYHLTAPAPFGEGAARAIEMALKMGGIKPDQIDYINAHGTSTALNDKNETSAIKTALGEEVASTINISSIKSMTGHLLGAAGGIELVATAKAIENSIIPPTINYETLDPDCNLNVTPNKAVERPVNVALSTSFGFGGHNSVIAIRKME